MCSWVLHRITGVAIFFFLLVHILDTALIRVSPEAYDAVIGTYKNPVMGIGEVALVGAIAYHAFNGLRIILVDFWGGPRATSASCGGSSWACGSSRCSASRRVTSSTSSPTWEGVTDDRSARLDRPRTAHPQPGLEPGEVGRSEDHTSELQPLIPTSYAVSCMTKKNIKYTQISILKQRQ